MVIGIMGAMPDEVDQLCARLSDVKVEEYGGVTAAAWQGGSWWCAAPAWARPTPPPPPRS